MRHARREGRPAPAALDRPVRRWRTAAVTLVAIVVAAGGIWGALAPRDSHHDLATGNQAAVPGGVLRLDGIVGDGIGHVMAGMEMADEVPAGMRRIALAVTVAATGDAPLSYESRDFTLHGTGMEAVVPVRTELGTRSVPSGAAVSGVLTFDIPDDATVSALRFRGGSPVDIRDEPADAADGHGHDDAGSHDHPSGGHTHDDAESQDHSSEGHAHDGEHPHDH